MYVYDCTYEIIYYARRYPHKYPQLLNRAHDSIALGEDGPTHQPVEQLANLRAIPNLTLLRPGEANETTVALCINARRSTRCLRA